jgi:hypothetical protein
MTAMPNDPDHPATSGPAPLIFHPRDWTPLQDEVLQVISRAGERGLGLAIVNRDLRNGLLEGALVAPDLTMTLLSRTDWEHRIVHAAHNPAEGVGVAPYEPGRYFVRRADRAEPAATPHPGGRKPVADWKMVEEEIFRLMNYHGEFSSDDPEWNAQARLEEAIADFCEDKFKKLPSETTIKEHVRQTLERWRRSRTET